MPNDVTLHDVYKARQKIAAITIRTPLIRSPLLTELIGVSVYLKAENLQKTGSFKIRGSANKMLSLTDEEKARGVITVSSGNHGRAVSYVAQRLGINAVVCLSERVPHNKVEAIESLGAAFFAHASCVGGGIRAGLVTVNRRSRATSHRCDAACQFQKLAPPELFFFTLPHICYSLLRTRLAYDFFFHRFPEPKSSRPHTP